jgi:hypothetical protein
VIHLGADDGGILAARPTLVTVRHVHFRPDFRRPVGKVANPDRRSSSPAAASVGIGSGVTSAVFLVRRGVGDFGGLAGPCRLAF